MGVRLPGSSISSNLLIVQELLLNGSIMKRAIKEAISGIVLVGSLIAIYFFIMQLELKSFDIIYSIAILLLVVICLISMVGLVIYSKTGCKSRRS
jgi:hypothetical protein